MELIELNDGRRNLTERKGVSLRLPQVLLAELEEMAALREMDRTSMIEYYIQLGRLHEKYATTFEARLSQMQSQLIKMEQRILGSLERKKESDS